MSEPNVSTKVCRVCKKEKPVAEFPHNRNVKGGYDSACKMCWRDISKAKSAKKAQERAAEPGGVAVPRRGRRSKAEATPAEEGGESQDSEPASAEPAEAGEKSPESPVAEVRMVEVLGQPLEVRSPRKGPGKGQLYKETQFGKKLEEVVTWFLGEFLHRPEWVVQWKGRFFLPVTAEEIKVRSTFR